MTEPLPRKVEIYLDPAGCAPFSEWLAGLKDRAARARVRVRIDRLRLGNFGDCKPVGRGVSELRVNTARKLNQGNAEKLNHR